MAEPRFFAAAAEFRQWLQERHGDTAELLVGFHKVDSGLPSITYAEALDEALCFGWIDGVRKRLDDVSYTIRFTPRKKGSVWSRVNIEHVERLIAGGQMQPAGLKAFQERDPEKKDRYSFERDKVALDARHEEQFKTNSPAWEFFQSQPPSYRKTTIWWVMSAKKEETRERRLGILIEKSMQGERIDFMKPIK